MLEAPVTALHCCLWSGEVLFSTGNQLYVSSPASASSSESLDFLPVTLQKPRLLAEVDPGDVIITVAVSSCRTPDETSLVLFSAADTVFACSLRLHPIHDEPQCWKVWQSDGHRLIGLRFLAAVNGFLALSTAATVSLLTSAGVEGLHQWRVAPFTGPAGLGVTLAADGCYVSTSAPETGSIHVYSGTYSGSICEWTLPNNAHEKGTTKSILPAHHTSCAIFSVQAVTSHHLGRQYISVATCSDDRTATVFQRCADASSDWRCIWRGGGSDFSLSRVFDISLLPVSSSSAAPTYLVGVASEDGGVTLVHLFSESGEYTAERLHRVRGQHSGHGARAIALGCAAPSREKPYPDRTAVYPTPRASDVFLVSGGFDGTVFARRVACTSAGELLKEGDEVLRWLVLEEAPTRSVPDKVRCVRVTPELHVLVCTEQYLNVTLSGETESHARGNAALSASPFPCRLPLPAPSSTKSQCRLHPTCVTTIPVGQVGPEKHYCAAVGTAHGEILLLPYRCRAGLAGPSATRRSSVSTALVRYHKCLMLHSAPPPQPQSCSDSTSIVHRLLVLVSSHVDHSVVLSHLVEASAEEEGGAAWAVHVSAIFPNGPGAEGSAMTCFWRPSTAASNATLSCWSAIGDRDGHLRLLECPLHVLEDGCRCDGEPTHLPKQLEVSDNNTKLVFPAGMGVARVSVGDSTPRGHHAPPLWLWSHTGAYAVVPWEALRTRTDIPFTPHPLYLGNNSISSVLFASERACIATCGTTGFFYTAQEGRLWSVVREVQSVRAPRLLDGNSSETMACVAHCSDGKTVEVCCAPLPPSLSAAPDVITVPAGGSTPLHGGRITGKDFNCCCAIHSPDAGFACGNEDSSLLVHTFYPSSLTAPQLHPQLLLGPHHSNILGVCSLKNRLVTVGGSATLAMWQQSNACDTTADTQRDNELGCGLWRVHSVHCALPSAQRAGSMKDEGIPRYLGVCGVDRTPGPNCEAVVAVASSDATVKFFETPSSHPVRLLTTVELSMVDDAHERNEARVVLKRPVLCVAPVLSSDLVLAGDAGGRTFVVSYKASKAVASLHVQSCAINALSAACVRRGESGAEEWEAAAVTDSGAVFLLGLRSDTLGAELYSLRALTAVSIGLTAGRGVAWQSREGGDVLAACEERVVRLRLTKAERAENNGMEEAEMPKRSACTERGIFLFSVVNQRRNTIRCVSGIAVSSASSEQVNGVQVLVVGQGMELMVL